MKALLAIVLLNAVVASALAGRTTKLSTSPAQLA
jgi:hypothetical protein